MPYCIFIVIRGGIYDDIYLEHKGILEGGPKVFSEGSGYISPYIRTWVKTQTLSIWTNLNFFLPLGRQYWKTWPLGNISIQSKCQHSSTAQVVTWKIFPTVVALHLVERLKQLYPLNPTFFTLFSSTFPPSPTSPSNFLHISTPPHLKQTPEKSRGDMNLTRAESQIHWTIGFYQSQRKFTRILHFFYILF